METVITSASNPTVKHLRKLLSSGKYRRSENSYVAEGIHLVDSLLSSGKTPTLVVRAKSAPANPEVTLLIQKLEAIQAPSIVVADSLFESITSIHSSVGILAVFTPEKPSDDNEPSDESIILLDDVQDPGNLGTIVRTAVAVGIKRVYASAGSASPWSPKALRAGMGAQFSLAIHENTDLSNLLDAAPLPSYATTLTSDSASLFDLNLASGPVAWLFGSEGQGVDEALVRRATSSVHIPQDGGVESLNVAAAAAVCLYEEYRQKRAA